MLEHCLRNIFITSVLALLLIFIVFYFYSVDISKALLAGLITFIIVYVVYYYYCLKQISTDTPTRFIQRVNIGFIVKVILTVSCFVFIKRHFQLNLSVSAVFFVILIVINDIIKSLIDFKNTKNHR